MALDNKSNPLFISGWGSVKRRKLGARSQDLYITGPVPLATAIGPSASGLDLFIDGGIGYACSGQADMPLSVYGQGSGTSEGADPFNNTMSLFMQGPVLGSVASGLSPGIATLFLRGIDGYGPTQDTGTVGTIPLFIGESGVTASYTAAGTPMSSGVLSFVITGISNMHPKAWRWNRSANVDSAGFIPAESGVTLFVQGTPNDAPTAIYINNAVTSLPETTTE
jgi:hypothetical protein